jgi:hypothetical protein
MALLPRAALVGDLQHFLPLLSRLSIAPDYYWSAEEVVSCSILSLTVPKSRTEVSTRYNIPFHPEALTLL